LVDTPHLPLDAIGSIGQLEVSKGESFYVEVLRYLCCCSRPNR
jgi:hypothetical protein